MRLFYVLDYVFKRTPDGRVWTDTSYDARFWLPYLEVYGAVTVVSRVEAVAHAEEGWKKVEGERVSVACLPYYNGAAHFALRSSAMRAALRAVFSVPGAVVLRMPSNLARCAAEVLERMGRAYALDVVGDPYEALAPGVVTMQGRAFFRQVFTRAQRRMCLQAVGVAYVAQTLANNYPAAPAALSLVCSDVRLDGPWLAEKPRRHAALGEVKLLTVATLSQTYKGLDVLLQALLLCRQRGVDAKLTIVGSGRYRESLESAAAQLGVTPYVCFAGSVPWGPRLMDYFDKADMFVLPSRVEVMPRVLLEAMARGLPAIATRVGAVPEILPECDMVPAGSAYELAERLVQCLGSPAVLDGMSKRNLAAARTVAGAMERSGWKRFHEDLTGVFMERMRDGRHTMQRAEAA